MAGITSNNTNQRWKKKYVFKLIQLRNITYKTSQSQLKISLIPFNTGEEW